MNRILIWTCAAALTVALSVWQRRSGPTYAVRGAVAIEGQNVPYRLERSFAGPGDAPVRIPAPALKGAVNFRPAGSNAAWTTLEMVRERDNLVAWLPHQPIALDRLALRPRPHRQQDPGRLALLAPAALLPPRPLGDARRRCDLPCLRHPAQRAQRQRRPLALGLPFPETMRSLSKPP
jgi:hypothetical protein